MILVVSGLRKLPMATRYGAIVYCRRERRRIRHKNKDAPYATICTGAMEKWD
jgi:hypothetical protein